MKYVAFVALLALVSAIDEKKEEQPQQRGLVWPLPDPQSEGDLMLHGSISFDRVQALHKQKLEDDVDKATWSHGRQFLRRVQRYFEETSDFRVNPVLCRDSRQLNGTNNRWEIEIPHQPEEKDAEKKPVQNDQPQQKEKSEKIEKADDVPHSNKTSNETETEKPSLKPEPVKTQVNPTPESYEAQRNKFYDQVGANFARLLIREHRKEQLSQEETQYLAHWNSDEAVHYGSLAIYCNEGENIKEIKKQLKTYLEDNQ